MKTEDEKEFNEQYDELLVGSSDEVRRMLESKRAGIKAALDKIEKLTGNRLFPLYPFMVPPGKEYPIHLVRPSLQEDAAGELPGGSSK